MSSGEENLTCPTPSPYVFFSLQSLHPIAAADSPSPLSLECIDQYVPTVQQQIQHPADRDFHEQQLCHQQRQQAQAQQQQQQQLMQTQQQPLEPRVLKYGSHGGGHGHAHHGSHSSQSSLDVDEMLLRATTGDEHAGGGAGTPNGSGTPYVDSPHHHHLGRSSTMPHRRSRGDRDGESPR
ncbi:hypothetical protein B0H34DRAFT_863237, partial [Crassisporium funariophilum]